MPLIFNRIHALIFYTLITTGVNAMAQDSTINSAQTNKQILAEFGAEVFGKKI